MKKLFLSICVSYTILSILYNHVLIGVTKLFIIPLSIMTISVLVFYGKIVVFDDLRKRTNAERKAIDIANKKENEDIKKEILRDYDTNVKPMYEQGRGIFSKLMKEKKLRNYDILDLKKLIDNRLGKYTNHYHNYKFKNDANEIYVKMKNLQLNEYDWSMILDYLHKFEDNEPINFKSNKPKIKVITRRGES